MPAFFFQVLNASWAFLPFERRGRIVYHIIGTGTSATGVDTDVFVEGVSRFVRIARVMPYLDGVAATATKLIRTLTRRWSLTCMSGSVLSAR